MARQRDYAAEYRRRIERAAELGLSRSQARGHARPSEASVRQLRQRGDLPTARSTTSSRAQQRTNLTQQRAPIVGSTEDRFYRVVNRVLSGESLTQAARAERIAPRTVKQLNQEREILGKTYTQQGKFKAWGGGEARSFHIFTKDGNFTEQVPFDRVNASIMGKYWNAVGSALEGKDAALKTFENTIVRDIQGNRYELLTDINMIRLLLQMMTDEEQQNFDRLIYQRIQLRRAA